MSRTDLECQLLDEAQEYGRFIQQIAGALGVQPIFDAYEEEAIINAIEALKRRAK